MRSDLRLFETQTLTALQKERDALLAKLQKGGRDARDRIRMEGKVKVLTARQIEIETCLGLGRRP